MTEELCPNAIPENEFPGLFQEICLQNCYHLNEVPFVPDVIFDIGANVGVFLSYARFLFPTAHIVAIEPNKRNWKLLLKHTNHFPNVSRLRRALSTGLLWHNGPKKPELPYYGGLESYITIGQLGFPEARVKEYQCLAGEVPSNPSSEYELAHDVLPISLDEMVNQFVLPNQKVVAKIDIEGGENCIFDHEPSMEAFRRLDFITMEIHFRSKGSGPEYDITKAAIVKALMSLEDTHNCLLDVNHYFFQAVRKGIT